MLPNSSISKNVFDEISKTASKGSVIMEGSTIEPHVAKEIYEKAKKMGIHYVDGPVSGGVNGAKAGFCLKLILNYKER